MHESLALWHLSAEKSVIQKVNPMPSGKEACTVRTLYSLVSTGTERLVALGKVPENLHQSMRVPYMEGSFPFPVKYGYSLVGQVEKGPDHLLGKYVHLLHPHQDYCQVNAADVFVLPHDVPPQRAILASNVETVLNAIWDAQVAVGDKVLITGFGIIGSLLGRVLQNIPAVQVLILEQNPARSDMARQLGFTLAGEAEYYVDIAFHTSGSSAGLQNSLDRVGPEGKVVELSWYGNQSVNVQLGGTFHSQRKQLISSQVSGLPADRRARWDFHRRKVTVFELLQDPAFDQHITRMFAFKELPDLFTRIRNGDLTELCWGVKY